jgi:hypothetical protein
MLKRAGAVALHDVALLVVLFGPKLQMIWYGSGPEGAQGSELLKNLEAKSAIKPAQPATSRSGQLRASAGVMTSFSGPMSPYVGL